MSQNALNSGLRAVHVVLTKTRELPGMPPQEQESIRFTEQDQRTLLRRMSDLSQDQVAVRRVAELTVASWCGLLRAAAEGYSFVPSSRMVERFGRTLASNYPEANPTFLKFANGYWTFRLLTRDVYDEAPDVVLTSLLSQLEQDTAALFFPTPGPVKAEPPAQREAAQRGLLHECVPELDLDEFMRGNPILIRDRKSSGWFSRLLR